MNNLHPIRDYIVPGKRAHLVGIGGVSMCPLAEVLRGMGLHVQGSDMTESDTVRHLRSLGIPVAIGHNAENLGDCDLVVRTAAVHDSNPEIAGAVARGIPVYERAQAWGAIMQRYPNALCVAGTHGKTTTTAMLTQILVQSGKDPTAIIGGKLPFLGGNSRVGSSEIMVCEACEYVDTFLQLTPAVSIILNIDADHLDYFKDLNNIIKSFHQFALQTTKRLVVNGDDANTQKAIAGVSLPAVTFGMKDTNDYYAGSIAEKKGVCEEFSLMYRGEKLAEIVLSVPGEHNIYNALAAAAAAHTLGVSPEDIAKSLHAFTGVHRRFEVLGNPSGIMVADDFAHHPTELSATLTAAMKMGFHTVWAVFQPHTYSRTALLLEDFAKALSIPDRVVMSEILPVREVNTYHIYTKDLADKIPGSVWFDTFEEITDYVTAHAEPGDLILTLGGGNVYQCADMILKRLQGQEKQTGR